MHVSAANHIQILLVLQEHRARFSPLPLSSTSLAAAAAGALLAAQATSSNTNPPSERTATSWASMQRHRADVGQEHTCPHGAGGPQPTQPSRGLLLDLLDTLSAESLSLVLLSCHGMQYFTAAHPKSCEQSHDEEPPSPGLRGNSFQKAHSPSQTHFCHMPVR